MQYFFFLFKKIILYLKNNFFSQEYIFLVEQYKISSRKQVKSVTLYNFISRFIGCRE